MGGFNFNGNPGPLFRIPIWVVATAGGLAAVGILVLFFFGSYSGLGSGL